MFGTPAAQSSALTDSGKLRLGTVNKVLSSLLGYGSFRYTLLGTHGWLPTHNPLVVGSSPTRPTNDTSAPCGLPHGAFLRLVRLQLLIIESRICHFA